MRHKHRVLHYWMLRAVGACGPERERFVEVFGYKCAISKKNLLKAREAGLWIFWFMEEFIGSDKRKEYQKVMKREYYDHCADIGYDFDTATERIIDAWLPLFENNNNEYYWSEHPF